jgi:hypothetical protein
MFASFALKNSFYASRSMMKNKFYFFALIGISHNIMQPTDEPLTPRSAQRKTEEKLCTDVRVLLCNLANTKSLPTTKNSIKYERHSSGDLTVRGLKGSVIIAYNDFGTQFLISSTADPAEFFTTPIAPLLEYVQPKLRTTSSIELHTNSDSNAITKFEKLSNGCILANYLITQQAPKEKKETNRYCCCTIA